MTTKSVPLPGTTNFAQRLSAASDLKDIEANISLCNKAYTLCTRLERQGSWTGAGGPVVLVLTQSQYSPATCARLLGQMMLNAPTIPGLCDIAQQIASCGTEEAQANLAKFMIDHFIRTFKKYKGPTAPPPSRPSQPSFDRDARSLNDRLEAASTDYRLAEQLCMERDGYRCKITKKVIKWAEAAGMVEGPIDYMEFAHIVSDSTSHDIGIEAQYMDHPKKTYASNVWSILQRYGQIDTAKDHMNGNGLHALHNVMLLSQSVHRLFDDLDLYLEPTGKPHEYMLHIPDPRDWALCWFPLPTWQIGKPLADSFRTYQGPEVITFESHNGAPLPDSRLLALHAACCKVARLSAAAACEDEIARKLEDVDVLASDGGSAFLLDAALNYRLQRDIRLP